MLTDQRLNNFASKLAQLFEPVVGEPVVVESDQTQEVHVKISHRTHFLNGIHPEFVRGADGTACVATTAGDGRNSLPARVVSN